MAMNVRLVQSLMQWQAMRNLYPSHANFTPEAQPSIFTALLTEMLGQISEPKTSPVSDDPLSIGTPLNIGIAAKSSLDTAKAFDSRTMEQTIDEAAAKYGW